MEGDGDDTTAKEQAEQIAKLSLQVERSYGQIQGIAVKAIQGPAAARPYGAGPSFVAEPRSSVPEK